MTDMEHAIEQAARTLWNHDNSHMSCKWRDMAWDDMGGSEPDDERIAYWLRARALADAGLLAPAPLREEWGRAYRQADGVLFVDDQDGSFRDRDDVAQLVPPQHPDSPYDLIVKRGATDWLPVDRAEGDGSADQ